nr:hypothetical protein [Butyricicoccus sp. OF13-6]
MRLNDAVPSVPVVMLLPPTVTTAPDSGAPYALVTTSCTFSRISPVSLTVRPAEILTVCVTAAVKRECVAVTTYEPRLT